MEASRGGRTAIVVSVPWQIIDLTSFSGTISAGKGALNVGVDIVPLADVSVILTGVSGSVHTSVFDRAVAFEIPILHCDWRGVPTSATLPWVNGSRVAARHRAQAALDVPRGKNAWMRMVKSKIKGQAVNLRSFDLEGYRHLSGLSLKVRSGDPSNLEGQAARFYWSRLFEDNSFRRVTRSRNEINGMLDYGYTIFRGASIRAIVSAGLWPSLGIWHRQRDNCFALADDLMEPFRPVVDAVVMRLAKDVTCLDSKSKKEIACALDLTFARKGYAVSSEMLRLAQQLARYIEGEISTLEVPVFSGLNED